MFQMSNSVKDYVEYVQKLKKFCISEGKKILKISEDIVIDNVTCRLLTNKICVQFIINDKIHKVFIPLKLAEIAAKNKSIENEILEF